MKTEDKDTKHTATPYEIDTASDSESSIRIGSASDRQASGFVARVYGANPQQAEANARFIVRACNSHAELLALLQKAWEFPDCPPESSGWQERWEKEHVELDGLIRAAISKAEGSA